MYVKADQAPRFDWRALGLPEAPRLLPHPSECPGDETGAVHIADCYGGDITADQLTDHERQWLLAQIDELARERRDLGRRYFAGRAPRRYANVQPDPRTADWVQKVTGDHHAAPGLLIIGPTGTGKTHLAWATIRAVSITPSAISNQWLAITAVDLYSTLRPGGSQDPDGEMKKLREKPLLFIDDLAAAKASEWTEEITYRLINHRYEQCLPTLITSNVPPAGMRDALGERVASRLVEMCERIVIKGEDRRRAA